ELLEALGQDLLLEVVHLAPGQLDGDVLAGHPGRLEHGVGGEHQERHQPEREDREGDHDLDQGEAGLAGPALGGHRATASSPAASRRMCRSGSTRSSRTSTRPVMPCTRIAKPPPSSASTSTTAFSDQPRGNALIETLPVVAAVRRCCTWTEPKWTPRPVLSLRSLPRASASPLGVVGTTQRAPPTLMPASAAAADIASSGDSASMTSM